MSPVDEIAPVYRKHLVVFEALRRTGIPAGDIFVAYNQGDPTTVVRTQGKQFTISMGIHIDDPEEKYVTDYQLAAEMWNATMTNEERVALYRHELSNDQFVDLVWMMRMKGLYLPEVSRVLGES